MAKVIIPTLLRKLTDNASTVEIEAETVKEVIERLDEKYPGFQARVCDCEGQLHRFINIYVDGEDVRFLEGTATRIPKGAEVSIVPAIAGG
jgi:molybdopterin synthase sulfur carrier subunit